jgi:hypothetical protein
MALLQLFDGHSGKPIGSINIPDNVLSAAVLVEGWLRSVNGRHLGGLTLRGSDNCPKCGLYSVGRQ